MKLDSKLTPLRRKDIEHGRYMERKAIAEWLRSLDDESGDIYRHLPTTLANWIEENMHTAGS